MNGTQIKYVFNLIEQVIIQRKCIFPEALFTFGSFAYFGWEVFSNINDQVMNYILISLEDKKNIPLIYQGLIAADDIQKDKEKRWIYEYVEDNEEMKWIKI